MEFEKATVQELVDEVKTEYPDYDDQVVNEYREFMREEGYTRKQINDFTTALGY